MLEAPPTQPLAAKDQPAKDQSAAARGAVRKGARAPGPNQPRRDLGEDFAGRSRVAAASNARQGGGEPEHYVVPRRFAGLRFRLRGGVGMPRSVGGRVLVAALALAAGSVGAGTLWGARTLLLHDPRLVLASSSAVEIAGNRHLTRAQLLSVFGEDVDRNLLAVPLEQRRAELEALPWVEHATVMRLLPDRLRVAIVERVPVAFAREGGHVGLVDAHGVLLDMDARDATADAAQPPEHFSFPVLTGIHAADPVGTRAARMHLYDRFTSALGPAVAGRLSEVDLSSPEDVKALLPAGESEVLVHFGETDFLARYRRFESNIAGWRQQYPHLSSVDLRYERQVVLEMANGAPVPDNAQPEPAKATPAAGHAAALPHAAGPAHPAPAKPAAKPAAAAHLSKAFPVSSSARKRGRP